MLEEKKVFFLHYGLTKHLFYGYARLRRLGANLPPVVRIGLKDNHQQLHMCFVMEQFSSPFTNTKG